MADDVYGTDILFVNNSTQVTPKGDLQEVVGVENLRRAILRRLVTRPGEYRLDPSYGVGVGLYVKKPLTSSLLAELRQRIVDQLSQDRRVDSVLEVVVEPTYINGLSALRVGVVVQALGRELRMDPFDFKREA